MKKRIVIDIIKIIIILIIFTLVLFIDINNLDIKYIETKVMSSIICCLCGTGLYYITRDLNDHIKLYKRRN